MIPLLTAILAMLTEIRDLLKRLLHAIAGKDSVP